MPEARRRTWEPIQHVVRGMCMGAADVVPGVSGGTVALVLGIYVRLIEAVSSFDRKWLQLLFARKWKSAWVHVDGPLLLPLASGIMAGIVLMSFSVHRLLSSDVTRPFTLAIFFGMIAASGWLVLCKTNEFSGRYDAACVAAGLAAFALAIYLSLFAPTSGGFGDSPPLWYVFLGGAIGICAMLLPGISGAMILLMIGLYGHLTGIPDALRAGEEISQNLVTLIVFGLGCATGILSFSRFLSWMLRRHGRVAMVALCGLMFGSLPRLWPFQFDTTKDVADYEDKILRPIWPPDLSLNTLAIAATLVGSLALLLAIHYALQRRPQPEHKIVVK